MMFLRWSAGSLAALCLFSFSVIADDSTNRDSDKPDTQPASLWVTGITQVGSTDQFIATTANGLLLRESTVMSFDVSDPSSLTPIYNHPAAAWRVDATSDGKTIASVDYRGNLVIYDIESKKATTHEKAFERWCQAMLIAPDDKQVVAGNEAGKLMVWDIAAAKLAKSIDVDAHAITGLAISGDAKILAASDGAGHIHLFDWPSLKETGKIEVGKEALWCVAFTPDNDHLLCGSSDRKLYRCDAKADAKAEVVATGKDWITRIAISPGGQVAASETGGRVHFPSLDGNDQMESKSGVWALCWNGDTQLLVGTRKDGLIAAGQSWKWSEPKPPMSEPTENKPAAEDAETKKDETKKDDAKKDGAKKDDAKTDDAKKDSAP